MLPDWSELRASLKAAIVAAIRFQMRRIGDERIAGFGLHIDGYYGSVGLYLLPESVARTMNSARRNNIGDWPISTDWNPNAEDAKAFAANWEKWANWFYEHCGKLDRVDGDEAFRGLLRIACEAVQDLEAAGFFEGVLKTQDFRIIIAEHDEPNALALERYGLFVTTGNIRVQGDPT